MDTNDLMRNILHSAQANQRVYAGYHDIDIRIESFEGDLTITVYLMPRYAHNHKLQRRECGEIDIHYWVFRESDGFGTLQARFCEMSSFLSDPKKFAR